MSFIDKNLFARIGASDFDKNKLRLVKKSTHGGHGWKVQYLEDNEAQDIRDTAGVDAIIDGTKLQELLESAANNTPLSQHDVQQDTVKVVKDRSFKLFARSIPGVETKKHKTLRDRIPGMKRRAIQSASIIGEGLDKLERLGYTGRVLRGNYWLEEVVVKDKGYSSNQAITLKDLWELEPDNDLSFTEWEEKRYQESPYERAPENHRLFLEWVTQDSFEKKEVLAYQASGTKLSIEEWRTEEAQKSSPFAEPEWLSKKYWERGNKASKTPQTFEEWRAKGIIFHQDAWKEISEEAGVTISFPKFMQSMRRLYFISALSISPALWLKKDEWQASGSPLTFKEYVLDGEWQKEKTEGKTTLLFDDWKQEKESKMREKYAGTHLPLSYEDWMVQQGDDRFVEVKPFIRLDEGQRKVYEVSMRDDGTFVRNGHTFDTSYESTAHGGEGYAIIVISPEQKMYAASHIRGVFHHSSFLGDSAVLAGGEIKTDSSGKIIAISGKSGHYRPEDTENLYLLEYFSSRGVDLLDIDFTFFTKTGDIRSVKAQEYLVKLRETIARRKDENRVSFTEEGSITKGNALYKTPKGRKQLLLFDERGEAYVGSSALKSLYHERTQKAAIQKLEHKIKSLRAEIETMRKKPPEAIKPKTGRTQPLMPLFSDRVQNKEDSLKKLERQLQDIQRMLSGEVPGYGEIKAGGAVQTDVQGHVVACDFRIGAYPMTNKEIIHTLRMLQSRGTDLKRVNIIFPETRHNNALEYLQDLQKEK
ncbi:MAG: hypothetical protein HN411_04080 [Waddliaceae bacterium]|jgi:hypothetical protein|nr:hypothetical protein [Waddliaceae bacterium]MBT3578791.1 hypothetical protein [Waddliaceae bacterium]MBT4444455.1 hypothetical protein [Waddliaceae bacterium]MBT6928606.1 hypothetical protein [Waddliaceae bacterium]MBT7264811.1 hypothetical protein [Waddliaceae bacterium]